MASRRKVTGKEHQVRSYDRDFQLEYARVLHETLLVPVLMCRVRQCFGKRRRDLDLDCTDG